MQDKNQEVLLEMELRLSLKIQLSVQHTIMKPEKRVHMFWQTFCLRKKKKSLQTALYQAGNNHLSYQNMNVDWNMFNSYYNEKPLF